MNGPPPPGSDGTFTLIRRSLLLGIGSLGLIAEIATPADARPLLLITDLVLVGIVPVEYFLERYLRRREP